jgi:hypothetical protein
MVFVFAINKDHRILASRLYSPSELLQGFYGIFGYVEKQTKRLWPVLDCEI